MLWRQFQVSTTHEKSITIEFYSKFKVTDTQHTHTLIATTYETKFFVDFVVRGLHSAAGVHFDTLCGRVRILTSFAVCQQEVFRQDRVASSQQMKGHF